MSLFTVLYRFYVPIHVLDTSVVANGLKKTLGVAPIDYMDPVCNLPKKK